MPKLKRELVIGWALSIVGVSLAALPLYAELFTMEQSDSEDYDIQQEEVVTDISSGGISMVSRVSFTMMYVSPWVPLSGGVIALMGGVLIGRSQRSIPKPVMSDSPQG
jgi:hypothetical protein